MDPKSYTTPWDTIDTAKKRRLAQNCIGLSSILRHCRSIYMSTIPHAKHRYPHGIFSGRIGIMETAIIKRARLSWGKLYMVN